MNRIEIIDSGHVTRDDAAFPTLVNLGNGELLCAYTVKGNGPNALGGTGLSRSYDSGKSWIYERIILPRTENPVTVNSLRLSKTSDGSILAYGSRDYLEGSGKERKFGEYKNEPVFCKSLDNGKTWSEPMIIPTNLCPTYEISNPIVDTGNNTWLAPAATLPNKKQLGERVVVFISKDKGKTWPKHSTVFYDPKGKKGFFEQKIIRMKKGKLLAIAWTVTLGDYRDLENHFSISNDHGETWSTPEPTGIEGQTPGPLYLGEDRLLVLSNRRYGRQGIVAYFVRLIYKDPNKVTWNIEGESLLWDAQTTRNLETENKKGIDAFDDFAFGLPSAIKLENGEFLAVHWCKEEGIFGIRWTKFKEI